MEIQRLHLNSPSIGKDVVCNPYDNYVILIENSQNSVFLHT